MSDSPAVILYDQFGNPVGVTFDGIVYRLQVESLTNRSSTATITTISSVNTDVLVLAANVARRGVFFYNNSNSPVHISLGTTSASLNSSSFIIPANSGEELLINYTGEIRCIWEVATGDLRVTELT